MNLPSHVRIRDVAPRDGFQSLPVFLPTDQKIKIVEAIRKAGLQEIEATSFVSPKAVPQMRDAAEVMAALPKGEVTLGVLVPNRKGAEMAVASGVDQLVVVISASEAHNQANLKRSIETSIADLDDIFGMASERKIPVICSVAVAFGCPYQGDVTDTEVFRVVDGYVSKGAREIMLCDTTGMATPPRTERLVKSFQDRYPDIRPGLHLHNNRETAMANLYAAILAGVDLFDTALGGIGGCPNVPQAAGNQATEDVVYMLEDMGIQTGIDLERLIRAARELEGVLGYTLPGQVMKSGPREPDRAARCCGIGAGH